MTSLTTTGPNGTLQFATRGEFPVSPGDSVYIGHTPAASKQIHYVLSVEYDAGLVTMEAHDVVELTANTVVIGMARDAVYNVVHNIEHLKSLR